MQMFNDVVLWLRLHSVIFMIAVFSLIVISAYWPSKRAQMQTYGQIPLRDDE